VIAVENVPGLLRSSGGADFESLCSAVVRGGYRIAPFLIDALHFLPQSRPRLFLACVKLDISIPDSILIDGRTEPWHTPSLTTAVGLLPPEVRREVVWALMAPPVETDLRLDDLFEAGYACRWHPPERTETLLSRLSDPDRAELSSDSRGRTGFVAALYQRTRPDGAGGSGQRCHVRRKLGLGCLTASAGSSRPFLFFADRGRLRSRDLTAREGARLMGLPEGYVLPHSNAASFRLIGEGVAVPAVAYLERHFLHPVLSLNGGQRV
jgi:DNA (cytosine-5)-methyltransferase 1